MKSLLDIDGPAMRFLTKIAYAAYLNILWFICCMPVFTVGASTTALFYVALKVAKDEESSLTKAFFHSFKENFRQSTVIWLILLVVGIFLGVDGYVFYHMKFDNALWTLGTAVFYVLLAAYAIVLMYIFPLLARFHNTVRAMFKNALMIGMRFLFCTALMALIYFIMAVVIINYFTPAIILGEGLCALLCSYLLSNILILCEGQTEGEEAAERESMASETSGDSESSGPQKREWSVKDVHGVAKFGYIWAYYKLPIVIIGIFLYIAGYMIYGNVTHKDAVLYTALINVSAHDTLKEELCMDYLDYIGANVKKEKVELYDGLYLTEDADDIDNGYVYASNTKITASIAGGSMDVVLMDRKAFDILANRGYFCNIEQFLLQEAPDLYQELQSMLVENKIIIEDNALDVQLGSSTTYTAVTDEYPMAVDLSQSELIRKEGFDDTLYLGVIANAPHPDTAAAFLRYLTE